MESTARTTKRPAVADVVRDHPHRSELAALCFDVVRRQARGRTLFSGRKYMRARAREHKVFRKRAGTPLGHVLDILERGAAEGAESDLIMAFAIDALGRRLDETGDRSLVDEFVRGADWLALATPYEPYAHVESLLSAPAQCMLAEAFVRVLTSSEPPSRPSAMRQLEALASMEGGTQQLSHLASTLDDAVLAAAAAVLAGERTSRKVPKRALAVVGCEGVQVDASGVSVGRVLGWVTGWALARWIGRGVLWVFGRRSVAGVWVDGPVVRCERATSMLGRQVHVIDESLRAAEVGAVVRELRHPSWVAVFGVSCLLAGCAGLLFSIDAAMRSESAGPLGWGLAALGLGAGLDLLLDYVARSRGARAWFEILAPGRPPLRLAGVDPEQAARVAKAIEASH